VGTRRATFPLYTSIAFDLTVTSLFTPLITGNAINVHEPDEAGAMIEQVFADPQNTVIKLTPAHLRLLRDSELLTGLDWPGTRTLIVGGEQLESRLAGDIVGKFRGALEIYNEYGPTEATVGCMIYRFSPQNDTRPAVPIGVPIRNAQIYLLDAYLKPVAPGVQGELYVGGAGVGAGYLFNEALTRQKFLPNPFGGPGMLYKTGDLGCQLPDGNLTFNGRADDQVKVRGYRIELGEVEHTLKACPGVGNAHVVAAEKDGMQYLAAYYVAGQEIDVPAFRRHFAERLPAYMMPSYFVRMDALPLTINGKIDRKALPPPTARPVAADRKPKNQLQRELAAIWAEILGIAADAVPVDANFFDLGGNSLRLMRMVNRVNKEFAADISVPMMFKFPVIEKIAEHLGHPGPADEAAERGLAEELDTMNETVDLLSRLP
jgi:iturin family lipopeptide synthetase A